MSIVLKHAVVHQLIKNKNEAINIQIQRKKESLLDPTSLTTISTIQELYEAYGKKENGAKYGKFKAENERGEFGEQCSAYLNDKKVSYKKLNNNEEEVEKPEFLKLSLVFMDKLIETADKIHSSTGGYIVCAHFTSNGKDFLLFCMVKSVARVLFDDDLVPQPTKSIDFTKLHQGLRINFETFQKQNGSDDPESENYLSFVGSKDGSASDYFVLAAGCEKGFTSTQVTEKVYQYVAHKFSNDDVLTKHKFEAKQSITEFLGENEEKADLNDLISHLKVKFRNYFKEGDERRELFFDSFYEEMNGEEYKIPDTFKPSKSVMKKKSNVNYKSNDLSLMISVEAIKNNKGAKIFWDAKNNELIIRANDTLAKEINAKINVDIEE